MPWISLKRRDRYFLKLSFNSEKGAASANLSNVPWAPISFAARINPPQAARAIAEPTEIRRTPRSPSPFTVKPGMISDN